MVMTAPDVLEMLRRGGILPVYWRRKRATARWHRGFRDGTLVVRSQCGKLAGADKGRLLFAPIDEPWPDPHCGACERATPGTDAAREGLDPDEGVSARRPRRKR
jgi:hypothetical protein